MKKKKRPAFQNVKVPGNDSEKSRGAVSEQTSLESRAFLRDAGHTAFTQYSQRKATKSWGAHQRNLPFSQWMVNGYILNCPQASYLKVTPCGLSALVGLDQV